MSEEQTPNQEPQGEATEQPQTGGVLSGEQTEQERLYAGKYKSVEDLEKSYSELLKKFSAGEHKQEAKPKSEQPKPQGMSEQDLKELQEYRVEKRRQAINKELELDYDADKWREVADYVTNNRSPEQIQAIETAIEAGLYGVVRDIVAEYESKQADAGEEMPTGNTPRSDQAHSSAGFKSADEAKEFLRKTKGLSTMGSGQEWLDRIAATPERIQAQLGAVQQDRPRFG